MPSPRELHERLPLSGKAKETVLKGRQNIRNILDRSDNLPVLTTVDIPHSNAGRLPAEFLCEHGRGQIAKARVAPLAIVKNLDVFPDRRFGLKPTAITVMMHQFVLQAAPEEFECAVGQELCCRPSRDRDCLVKCDENQWAT